MVRHVPSNVSVATETAGATFAWAAQGGPKVAGNLQLSSMTLGPAKASGIVVVSAELVKLATRPATIGVVGGLASEILKVLKRSNGQHSLTRRRRLRN